MDLIGIEKIADSVPRNSGRVGVQYQIGQRLVVWHVHANSVEFIAGGMVSRGERDRIFDVTTTDWEVTSSPGAQVEVGCDLVRAGDVGHRDRVGAIVNAGTVVEFVEGCDVD